MHENASIYVSVCLLTAYLLGLEVLPVPLELREGVQLQHASAGAQRLPQLQRHQSQHHLLTHNTNTAAVSMSVGLSDKDLDYKQGRLGS